MINETNETKALLTTKAEIGDNLTEAWKKIDIYKGANKLNRARVIFLNQDHAKGNETTEVIEKVETTYS